MAALEDLERRLAKLEAIEAIRALRARIGRLYEDKHRAKSERENEIITDQIAELFAEDATWDGGTLMGSYRGREEIRERLIKPIRNPQIHYLSLAEIVVEDDLGHARWNTLVANALKDGTPAWTASEIENEYAKVGGKWLISSEKMTVPFFAERTLHPGVGHMRGL